MKNDVKNFVREIVLTILAAAALCIFCFVIMGPTSSHFGFLALLFPIIGMLVMALPTPDYSK